MRVKHALIADYANVTQDGKLNVMGVFGRILSPSFPVTHPSLYLVLVFIVDAAEEGLTREFRIRLVDDEDTALIDVTGTMQATEVIGPSVEVQQILAFQMIQFPRPGAYSFQIDAHGESLAIVPLGVERPAPLGL